MPNDAPKKPDFLDPRLAYTQAQRFQLIPGFPVRAVEQAANELRRLCTGGYYKAEYWPPARQAIWLGDEACRWPKWQGIGALSELFGQRFPEPEPGARRPKHEPPPGGGTGGGGIGPLFDH
jgi:hypothetical protein